jgi:hypothetical protein
MKDRITAPIAKVIEQLVAEGASQPEIARKVTHRFKLSPALTPSAVSRHLSKKTKASAFVPPTQSVSELAAMTPADRLEVQLSSIDGMLAQPSMTPAVRARFLTLYSHLLERATKLRAGGGKGERQFDGLADLLLSATHADSTRWSTDPADWLADVVPRQLPELHEVAGALERVPAEARKATAERMRPVLHRILALLDAV